ncbi:prolyl oligopeptidase family serine peptidase [Ferrovibrio terrae]|uniref:prolyl oligopeptidase family serine peptidase n=1 Tax=Ferrovibrio terrae TaxID=2594003 RepID=UPI0031381ADF
MMHPSHPPVAPQDDSADILHGVRITDPFRPLEDSARPDVQAWVEAQDERCRAWLKDLPGQADAERYLRGIWDYPKQGIPSREGQRWFLWLSNGLDDQFSFATGDSSTGPWRILLDGPKLSADGTVSISGVFPSRDGNLLAYLLSDGGSDRQVLHLMQVDSGMPRADRLEWCKHTSVAWVPDSSGFYYTRIAAPDDPPDWDRRSTRVYFHRLGDAQGKDICVFAMPEEQSLFISAGATYDGTMLSLYLARGTDERNGIVNRRFDARLDAPFETLSPLGLARFWPVAHRDGIWHAVTDLDAPNCRIVRLDGTNPASAHWQTIIPESEHPIQEAAYAGGHLLVKRMVHVSHRLTLHDMAGHAITELPFDGQVGIFFGAPKLDDREFLLAENSYRHPQRILRYDIATRSLSVLRDTAARFNLDDMEIRQVFVEAKDGTRIPLTVMHRRDLQLDGTAPVKLYAYGGFSVPMMPSVSFGALHWLRMGGIFAVASIRGGGEYGRTWHEAARGVKRQVAFDDFIACAEWLAAGTYSRSGRIGIIGGSNGGLLVAACMLQRPDLFGAVVCQVPVTDMLRYDRFTFGSFWRHEYGDPTDPEAFAALLAYSPLHNVKANAAYPPILITTGDHDDRVVPAHAYKFGAALQANGHAQNVTLLRIDRRAGHGMGKPTWMSIAEIADVNCFLMAAMGVQPAPLPQAG